MAQCIVTADCSNLKINATQPASPQTRQGTNSGSKFVITYTASTQRAYGVYVIPPNYLTGSVIIRVRCCAPVATAGTCSWGFNYMKMVDGSGLSTAFTANTLTLQGVGAVANDIFELVFTLSSNLPTVAVPQIYAFYLSRTTADTITGDIDLLDYDVEYTFDPNITKQYTWLPANIWLAIAGSPSSFGSGLTQMGPSVNIDPYAHQFPDSAGNKVGTHIQLPSTFVGGLVSYAFVANGSHTGNIGLDLAMGSAAVGSAYDAALTTDAYTMTVGGASSCMHIESRAAPITPAAGEMLSLQMARDNADANTSTCSFYGVLLEYNVFTASPSPVIGLSPECWSAPTSDAASLTGVADTNNTAYVQRFAQSLDQHCETKRIMPSIRVSGGTFRGYLRTAAASGTIKMRIDYGNPAIADDSDPVLTTGTTINVPVTGADELLMFTADVSTGLISSDEVILSMYREGTTDGVTADVDYVEGQVEVGVGA